MTVKPSVPPAAAVSSRLGRIVKQARLAPPAGLIGPRWRLALISVAGCFISLLGIGVLTWYFFPQTENLLLLASFGSSAILIFTVPELLTAQPWPAVTGHVIAALAGVFIRENVALPHFITVAAAVAVSLLLMFLTDSLHPPAGGTAIMALNADGTLAAYGYWLALFPMAVGMAALVILAVAYLNLAAGRRYPCRRDYRAVAVDRERKSGH